MRECVCLSVFVASDSCVCVSVKGGVCLCVVLVAGGNKLCMHVCMYVSMCACESLCLF